MKTTRNMYFEKSDEARELEVFTMNYPPLWYSTIEPNITNLQRIAKRGKYDHNKALTACYNIANAGAKAYYKEFCTTGYTFTVTQRYTAACMILEYIENQYINA